MAKTTESYRSRRTEVRIHLIYEGLDRSRPRLTVQVNTGDASMTIESTAGRVMVVPGQAASPDLVLSGPPDGIAGLLGGRLDLAGARRRGVAVKGDARKLAELRPRSAPRTKSRTNGA